MLWQPTLPEQYFGMDEDAQASAIEARRAQLGTDLVILGHHYQQDEVIQHADFTGDSFKLSQLAAEKVREQNGKYIIFCGVHFMAESADILTPGEVQVILPDLSAGCSMADMADYEQTCQAWDEIQEALGDDEGVRVIPITYMNSTAAVKAFVGKHGGAVCTSSNAEAVFDWALKGGDEALEAGEEVKILFLPDQHLGRNTAHSFGMVTEVDAIRTGRQPETAVWNPKEEFGGLTFEEIHQAKVLLWKGHCSVHMLFRPEHVEQMRAKDPEVKIVVHPECRQEVVDLADETGSTGYILNCLRSAKQGEHWAVGTEVHLINRIAAEMAKRGVKVESLSGCQCMCTTMYRISPERLLWALDQLAEGKVVNEIRVHEDAREGALLALDRMLRLTGSGAGSAASKRRNETVPQLSL